MLVTIRRFIASSVISHAVHAHIGQPLFTGSSSEMATIWQYCSAPKVYGAPLRCASAKHSLIAEVISKRKWPCSFFPPVQQSRPHNLIIDDATAVPADR